MERSSTIKILVVTGSSTNWYSENPACLLLIQTFDKFLNRFPVSSSLSRRENRNNKLSRTRNRAERAQESTVCKKALEGNAASVVPMLEIHNATIGSPPPHLHLPLLWFLAQMQMPQHLDAP